ncbi:ferredoxin hydrogenase [uncultured Clostridium sp.]|uniref:ferredoxin hydrogenase n=1 Tax=uncultured Clostridium sp. TaxID=59620 RepID=UPI002617FF02|nr:ferredoxin hydrogenase [uncultured Clostridium sp.]
MGLIKINEQEIVFEGEKTVLELARENNIHIPALCYYKECSHKGICGICLIEIDGKDAKVFRACVTKAEDGMIVTSESDFIKAEVKKELAKILNNHDFKCGFCKRKESCELLKLVREIKAIPDERKDYSDKSDYVDDRSSSLVIDRSRCVKCGRCVASCSVKTTTKSILFHETDNGERIIGARDLKCFDDTGCLLCGQCLISCPVDALQEKSHIERVLEALEDEDKHVIVCMAPSVRAALGEEFNMGFGVDVTKKTYTALRMLGFDKVFDLNFAADVTIMEEASELIDRLSNGGTLPMFTSCCPGWIRLIELHFPELIGNLSTTKSPMGIFGAASKYYYPKISGIPAKDVYTVSIMPCIVKKFEMERPEMENFGERGIDAVLTTREFARILKSKKIDFKNLEDGEADPSMGEYTGAGAIFGATGGVMEAALRTAKDVIENKDLEDIEYTEIRGFKGVKESTINIAGTDHKVAVINGASNFFKFVEEGNLAKGYTLIEVMDCPGGCVNGGGQPFVSSKIREEVDYVKMRASVLYNQDEKALPKRKSHDNIAMQKMYDILGNKPGEGIAHELFHTKYHDRGYKSNKNGNIL